MALVDSLSGRTPFPRQESLARTRLGPVRDFSCSASPNVRDEEGARRGKRSHRHCNAGFDVLPEDLPDSVERFGRYAWSRATAGRGEIAHLHEARDDHEDAETKCQA